MNTKLTAQYNPNSPMSVLRDAQEHIDFHIKTGDYFNFIATAIGFFEEGLAASAVRERVLAEDLRRDLRHVNDMYQITPKAS
ncbi:MAG: hypothetical protein WCW36_02380 [Candidatus Paceibacterota bacterium]|jgi:hypothetical protein